MIQKNLNIEAAVYRRSVSTYSTVCSIGPLLVCKSIFTLTKKSKKG